MSYREPNTVGGHLSPACGGGKITSTHFFLIDKGILQWCIKGITILRFSNAAHGNQFSKNQVSKVTFIFQIIQITGQSTWKMI